MIKPEDVPESLVYDVYAQIKRCLELDEIGTPVSTEQQIADLLNLCVDAGVVSPPVKCIRFTSGKLATLKPFSPVLYKGSEGYF